MSQRKESPCIGVCLLDEKDVCVGCERHINEIVNWPSPNIPPINLNNSLSADNFYPDETYNKEQSNLAARDDSEEHW